MLVGKVAIPMVEELKEVALLVETANEVEVEMKSDIVQRVFKRTSLIDYDIKCVPSWRLSCLFLSSAVPLTLFSCISRSPNSVSLFTGPLPRLVVKTLRHTLLGGMFQCYVCFRMQGCIGGG